MKRSDSMEGWIKVHRKLVDWEWYNDINVKVVFLHLLLTANHKEKQWKGQTILRGQKLTSIEHLADDVGLTIQQTRTALKKLKSTHEITIKTTNKNTLITIEKFKIDTAICVIKIGGRFEHECHNITKSASGKTII